MLKGYLQCYILKYKATEQAIWGAESENKLPQHKTVKLSQILL